MNKRKEINKLSTIDASTHQFTLQALDLLYDLQDETDKRVARNRFHHDVQWILALGVMYFLYSRLNRRINKMKKEEQEVTAEQ